MKISHIYFLSPFTAIRYDGGWDEWRRWFSGWKKMSIDRENEKFSSGNCASLTISGVIFIRSIRSVDSDSMILHFAIFAIFLICHSLNDFFLIFTDFSSVHHRSRVQVTEMNFFTPFATHFFLLLFTELISHWFSVIGIARKVRGDCFKNSDRESTQKRDLTI